MILFSKALTSFQAWTHNRFRTDFSIEPNFPNWAENLENRVQLTVFNYVRFNSIFQKFSSIENPSEKSDKKTVWGQSDVHQSSNNLAEVDWWVWCIKMLVPVRVQLPAGYRRWLCFNRESGQHLVVIVPLLVPLDVHAGQNIIAPSTNHTSSGTDVIAEKSACHRKSSILKSSEKFFKHNSEGGSVFSKIVDRVGWHKKFPESNNLTTFNNPKTSKML